LNQSLNQQASNPGHRLERPAPPDLMETRRGDPPPMNTPPQMPGPINQSLHPSLNQSLHPSINQSMNRAPTPPGGAPQPHMAYPQAPMGMQGSGPNHHHNYPSPLPGTHQAPPAYPQASSMVPYGDSGHQVPLQLRQQPQTSSKKWIWWVVGLLALGAAAGALFAVLL
ncbi:MAG: hypothetical protein ABI867_44655, partial [Kofleriaceae bacterium]